MNSLNGKDVSQQQVRISPVQLAAFLLQLMERVPFTKPERIAFDLSEQMLQAIVNGQLVVTPPVPPPSAEPPPAEPPPPAEIAPKPNT